MRIVAPAAALFFSLAACGGATTAPPSVPPAAAATTSARAAALSLSADPRVDVALVGSPRVLYSPVTLRAPRPTVRVTIVNTTGAPLDVSDLHVHLELTRDGVEMPCEHPAEPRETAREPHVLAAGATATYLRTLDCPLSLAGTYAARVEVAFGASGAWSEGRAVRELAITVDAPPDAQPRALRSVPGLFAALGSSGVVAATPAKGRMVVSLVNASTERVALPPMRLALRVRKVNAVVPCEDEPVRLDAPGALDPGASRTVPVDVSCLGLGVTGTYDVEARLLVERDGQVSDEPIGALRVEVTSDPARNRRILQ